MSKLRLGVVGTNFITDWVITGARQDERLELTAVCSRRQETAAAFANKHGIRHIFTSLDDMARSPLIDAVYIASPNFLHASQSNLCMRHGKHVLCEKPLASNATEAKEMIATSKRYNVALMEAMKPTLTPNFLALRNNLERIGTPRRYFASFCQYSSRYDTYKQGSLPNTFRPDYSNGATMDIGTYTIYPMIVLFGRPQQIQASGVLLSSGVDGQAAVNFLYEGMNATVIYSKIANSALPTEIQGEEGFLTLDRIHTIRSLTFTPRSGTAPGKGLVDKPIDLSMPLLWDEYYYEIAEFINLVRDGRCESEINSHANSLATLEVIDEIRRQMGVVYPADTFIRI
ncbi:MAG: Gfo/Idh/MocA family oxidoreductase [Tannerellaceae bacterium]|jgi:predicted dehydrogenase|nr:Gfo/Idh/MocA family oxidoreductase [Tannerellaceae bacterium]